MGLDMYLKASLYVSGYEHNNYTREYALYHKLAKELDIEKYVADCSPSANIEFTVGYWRKANQIHKWFVFNCQDGQDDCGTYWVNRDLLVELRDKCKQVLEQPDLANELLPSESGFFFGGTDYDEYYFKELEETIEIIDRVLGMPEKWSFDYQSSW